MVAPVMMPDDPPLVLVVEDNPVTRKSLRLWLESEGYAVAEAADANAALAHVAQAMPDLVLQDLILPGTPGLELMRRLRALPGGARLPIVACSGYLTGIEEARALPDGFNAFLLKPVDPARLLHVLRSHLAS